MHRIASAWAFSAISITASTAWGLPADTFNDNTRGPEWALVQDEAALSLAETNARLEVLATSPASASTDALYLSNGAAGYRVSTAADFSLAIDYSFTAFAGSTDNTALALVLGIGRDLDGTDSAAVGFGYADLGPVVLSSLAVAHRTDDAQSIDATSLAAPTSGTFLITYNAAGDDLSLGLDGAPAAFTLTDTVRGVWGASDLLVSFGARGNGFTTTSGQAFLDDFEVRTGTIVPEPATLGILALGAMGTLRRRRRINRD